MTERDKKGRFIGWNEQPREWARKLLARGHYVACDALTEAGFDLAAERCQGQHPTGARWWLDFCDRMKAERQKV